MTESRKYNIAQLYTKLNELIVTYNKVTEEGQSYIVRKDLRTQMRNLQAEIDKLQMEENNSSPEA